MSIEYILIFTKPWCRPSHNPDFCQNSLDEKRMLDPKHHCKSNRILQLRLASYRRTINYDNVACCTSTSLNAIYSIRIRVSGEHVALATGRAPAGPNGDVDSACKVTKTKLQSMPVSHARW